MSSNRSFGSLRLLLSPLALGILAAVTTGCGSATDAVDGTGEPVVTAPVVTAPTELRAVLRGSQETPPVSTTGTGTANATLSGDRATLQITVQTQGLSNVTAGHIHVGPVGTAGPIILGLYDAGTDGPFPGTLTRTLTAANLQARPAQGVSTFEDVVRAIFTGQTYVNIHTQANPGGEIRGQLGPVPLRAILGGDKEVPPVATAAGASADIQIDATQSQIRVILATTNIANAVAAHFHVGPPGQNGPIILPLYNAATDGPFPSVLSRIVTANDLQPQPSAGIVTFDDALNAILSGNAYINVHTQQNPGGEIRGQVVP